MAMTADATPPQFCKPPFRSLRAYAFDPTSALTLDQAIANEVTLKVPWEDLTPGPVGEYVEVIDYDPESECFYAPVDLNAPPVLVQAGLPPAQGVPQFHQQMVYALVMSTIRHFERGLGRAVLWAPRFEGLKDGSARESFVQRLRVYPHALRGEQTYYSPAKRALLMGYFPVDTTSAAGERLRTTSFACLSPATVAHETAHAILHGLQRTVGLADSADALAVQEALADLTGLFQQFAVPGFLRDGVDLTADLDRNQRLLEEMTARLAQPTGPQAELRKRIGAREEPAEKSLPLLPRFEERASALVAAVFAAFLAVWRQRCARLLALAGVVTAVPQPLSGELREAASAEAAKCAAQLLHICIRAIDYCPPVDVTIGDYLRALVTADAEGPCLRFSRRERYLRTHVGGAGLAGLDGGSAGRRRQGSGAVRRSAQEKRGSHRGRPPSRTHGAVLARRGRTGRPLGGVWCARLLPWPAHDRYRPGPRSARDGERGPRDDLSLRPALSDSRR
jgi:hypothetical protein